MQGLFGSHLLSRGAEGLDSGEDVIRFVITELGLKPLRSDWENVLSDAQAAHQSWRTWS